MQSKAIRASVCLLVAAHALLAQRYSFKYYGQETGLASLDVSALLQDQTGFLWVGTENGLFRYDGRRFRAFTTADGLPSMNIESLAETPDGTLWVATVGGLVRLVDARRVGDRFEPVDISPARRVRQVFADAHGRLLVGTPLGLMVANVPKDAPAGLRFRLYPGPDPTTRIIQGIAVAPDGTVYYGCGKSLCRLQDQRVTSLAASGVPPDDWTAVAVDGHGNVWARSLTRLIELPKGARQFVPRDQGLPAAVRFGKLYVDRAGQLHVPTCQGLAHLAPGGSWSITGKANGLAASAVECVTEDREGSIWIGFNGGGLVRWLGYRRWEAWTEAEGLSHDVVWSIGRDAAGDLWAATETGLDRFNPRTRRWQPWRHGPLGTGQTLALAPAPDGKLWVAQTPAGLVEVDPRRAATTAYGTASGLTNTSLYSLAVDPSGNVWAGTREGLFEGVRTAAGFRFSRRKLPGEGNPSIIFSVLADQQGRIWAASWYGLCRFEAGRWKRFTTRDGLRHNSVMYITEAPGGSFWVGYREPLGISRFTVEGDRLRLEHFSRANGMRSDKPFFLAPDRQGRLWVGTDIGVEMFDGRAWTAYDTADGMVWNDCDHNAFFADSDGSVWIGTSRGLSHFYASAASPRPVEAPVVLTSLLLGNQPVTPAGSVSVPYARRALHASFAGLSFVNEQSVRFRYHLQGLDTDWTETRQTEAHYLGLFPGRYTFEVQAAVAPGRWTPAKAAFPFTIQPPWWLTWWAFLLLGALAYGVARLLWAWRLHSVMKKQRALETAVEERTRSLVRQKVEIQHLLEETQQAARLKSEFLANISHEIRTPMNGIIGMTDIVLSSSLNADQAECLRLVKVSADSLLAVINDILDFSKIESGKFDLDHVEFSTCTLVHDTIKSMEIMARQKNLALSCRSSGDVPDRLIGDAVRLRQVLVNLIGNAIKFTSEGAVEVIVASSAENGSLTRLQISVRDTGIGIPEDKQKLIFEPFRQADGSTSRRYGGTGLGLAICARLVGLMNGKIWVESRPGAGSTFHFTVELLRPGTAVKDVCGAPAESHPDQPRLEILVAEDNAVNQKLARRILEARGHRVVAVNDGLEAVAAFRNQPFDLVLMDIQMPRMDGYEATAEIRKLEAALRRHTPILALTANAMKGDRERCLHAGMDGYLPKPLRPPELFGAIRDLLLVSQENDQRVAPEN